ncbi:hypothetical protein [Actinomadura rupiterrae]|uniref:hypothetical protein n=1 Tax=Actinomadura rupiterrae TaxID=559627 RepID=UPI0020A25836|nr:hypothetical protein [Actinomadura rupiterrae]MCP2338801.1 hypothetical protein [Actinomadura rupiterrae]
MDTRLRHLTLGLAAGLAAVPLVSAVPANAASGLVLERSGPARSVSFTAARDGEALLGLTVAAPGVSWARKGAEAALVAVSVDGRHVTDLLVPAAGPTPRTLGLGGVRHGRHKVTFRFAKGSAPAARRVLLSKPKVRQPKDDQLVLRHAPVVVGRTLNATGGPGGDPYQNAYTDAPLIAWHETRPAATPGHKILEYSVIWSNEDGGTDTPALMARWGRTTDIEWVYRVEVDAAGNRVADTAVYQAPEHQTLKFTGRYEGDHPVMQTCTLNNNMCDTVTPDAELRFLLDTTSTRPDDRAREYLMDQTPWTYRITAQEMDREGKIENPSSPDTPAVGDLRTYLYLEFSKTTGAPTGTGSAPGVSIGVRLKKDPARLYRSDHSVPSWSISRDGSPATTIELPAGTTVADIASVEAVRQPTGAGDNGASATVTAIRRGFFLDRDYLPQSGSSITWTGSVTVSPSTPTAQIWHS